MRVMLISAALAGSLACFAGDPTNMTFDTELKSVAIFQTGFGYFVREGKAKLEDGWCTTKTVPAAVRGTIWVYSLDGDPIDTLLSTKANNIQASGADAIKKALANKIGLDLSIDASGRTYQGKLAKLLDDMLLLDIGGAYTAINYGPITRIGLVGYPLKIRLDTDKKDKIASIGMSYIQEGVRWEPSYILEMKDGQPGKLTLRGTVLNLPEGLKTCDLLFVVGSPQISNRGQGETFTAGNEPAADKDDAKKEKDGAKPGMEPELRAAPTAPNLSSEGSGELYYYKKPGFSMEKSDIAMVTIFQNNVSVTPQFEWLADGEEVAYLLKIENKTGQTFTDGPVFVVENGKPIGQETIKNTPSGSYAELRLAKAFGLRTERQDVEVGRGSVMTVGKTQFLPVKMKGTLKLTNYRATAASIKITRSVRGKLGVVTGGGVTKDTQVFTGDPNAVYKVEWNVTVPPNGTLQLDYDYETYTAIAKLGGPPVPEG